MTYWEVTPAVAEVIFSGGNDRLFRNRNEMAWLAYHVAALTRAKKMPRLQSLMMKTATPKAKRQTWQEQMAVMDQWAAVMDAMDKAGKLS